MKDQVVNVCNRLGCGDRLVCSRSDCPLVILNMELGLHRIATRAAFLDEVKYAAAALGLDASVVDVCAGGNAGAQ